jgi:hypothetical protein
VERVIELGTLDDFREIIAFYGYETVKNILLNDTRLSARDLHFCSVYFDIDKSQFACYTKKSSTPKPIRFWNLDQTPFIAPIDEQEGIRMFSLQDIAALKIDVVAGYNPRHDKKDFFDIYILLKRNIFSMKEMFSFFEQREGEHNFLDVLKNFLYNMELADQSRNPRLIDNAIFDWLKIKTELKETVRNCIHK